MPTTQSEFGFALDVQWCWSCHLWRVGILGRSMPTPGSNFGDCLGWFPIIFETGRAALLTIQVHHQNDFQSFAWGLLQRQRVQFKSFGWLVGRLCWPCLGAKIWRPKTFWEMVARASWKTTAGSIGWATPPPLLVFVTRTWKIKSK